MSRPAGDPASDPTPAPLATPAPHKAGAGAERHSTRAAPALRALAEADPALAALSLWCRHRDGDATATRGTTITYGPDFEALPAHEQRGLAAHHVLHVALRHSARLAELEARLGQGVAASRYNLAADAIVNEALLAADHALPRPAVTLTGLLEERLGRKVAPEAALADWDADRLYHALAAAPRQGRGGEAAEEGARGFAPDLEPEDGTSGAAEPGTSEEAARWRRHLARAMEEGRRAGRGLGRIGHRIADIPEPRIPWELLLRRLLARALAPLPRPAPARPSRRWLAATAEATRSGGPMPGFEPGRRPLSEVARIAVALDASGSVDDARLALFWGELGGIARRMRAELHLMVFDDAIRHRARIEVLAGPPALPEMPRGGGTDFRPVLAEARALEAAALVVLTDLDGEAGPPPRGLRVIWAVPDAAGLEAPFGRLLDLSG